MSAAESSAAAPWVVRTHRLGKRYGTFDAVAGLDLAVRRGEIYGFLGPNGAGKTTTLLMLLGIERPSSGYVELFGRAGPVDPFRDKPRIGVVGEQQYLYDDLSAWEYLLFFGRLYGVERPEARADELLEQLGLTEFRRLRARDYSRGMQQKLGLARALLHRPELLVLDEPVSGLDPHGIAQVREILLDENRRGTTVLLSSHILSEVERTAHRVGVLAGGRLVAEDDVASLGARLQPDTVIEVDVERLAAEVVERLASAPFVRAVEVASGMPTSSPSPTGDGQSANGLHADWALLRVRVAAQGDHRRDVSEIVGRHGGLIVGMRQERPTLEESFIRLTSESIDGMLGDVRTAALDIAEGAVTEGTFEPKSETVAIATPAPSSGARWAARRRAVATLARRDLLSLLHGPGIYVVVALGMLAAVPVVFGHLDAVERGRVLVVADLFTLPFFVAATLGMLFLALASIATIARERDGGTLEVLFYGPVDVPSYVLGKHVALVLAYGVIGLGLAVLFLATASIAGPRLTPTFGWGLLLSLFAASAVAALGICLAGLVRGVRAGVALLGGLAGLLLLLGVGSDLLAEVRVANNQSPLLFARELVIGLDGLARYVSPFGVFQTGVDAAMRGDWLAYIGAILAACLQTILLLTVAARLVERRGVRR